MDIRYSLIALVRDQGEFLPTFHDGVSHELKKLNGRYELVYVDNGSVDNSPAALRKLAAADAEHTQVVRLDSALPPDLVLSAAFSASHGETCIVMPADGTIPLTAWTRLLEKLRDGADLACGRQPDKTPDVLSWPAAWLYSHALAAQAGNTVLHDLYCNAFAAKRDVLDKLLPTPRGQGRFLPAFAMRADFRVSTAILEHNDYADTPPPFPADWFSQIADLANAVRAGVCIFGPAAVFNTISLVGLTASAVFAVGALIQALIAGCRWPALLILMPALVFAALSGCAWLQATAAADPPYGMLLDQLRRQNAARAEAGTRKAGDRGH